MDQIGYIVLGFGLSMVAIVAGFAVFVIATWFIDRHR